MKEGFCDFAKVKFTYFDYAATTFMPECVIRKQYQYNRNICVSANRGKSLLSDLADAEYKKARDTIKGFFSRRNDVHLMFSRNASQAINEIARSIEKQIRPMDIILLGPYEHHSNYLPWRELAKRQGAIVFEMPLLEDGKINMDYLDEISDRIKVLSFSSVANANGHRLNAEQFSDIINEDTIVIVDDSQKCAHETIEDNQLIDCHIVNSHKMYGPKGIAGALISDRLLGKMEPCVFGGGMIERIGFPNVWKNGVGAYECGTMDVSNAIAWEEACRFIGNIGYEKIHEEEKEHCRQVLALLKNMKEVEIVSNEETTSIVSFYHRKMHVHDIEEAFSANGIIIRTGHLCSQNSIMKYDMNPIARISFGISNDKEDINALLETAGEIL